MTSWRDHSSVQAQKDLDALIDPSLDFGKQQLAKHGEFFPFAMVVRPDGQPALMSPMSEPLGNRPTSGDVIDALRAMLAEQRDTLRAAAIISDVHASELGSDAIQAELEHVEGAALVVLFPYKKKRLRSTIDYGQLRASNGRRRIWAT